MIPFQLRNTTLLIALIAFLIVLLSASCLNRPVNNNVNAPASSPTPAQTLARSAPPPEQQSTNILFIVDASGSMKAKAGGKTKIDAAKEVVTGLINNLPATVNAGLMAYGHRQKNECKDIELLIPVGPVDKNTFDQKINSLTPLGETPISAAIRRAAQALQNLKGKKTVILISDGEETCHEDPCALAAELKKADVDLQVHVVGFGIDSDVAKKQLHCIAEATGGVYKDAANASELKKTLEGLAKGDGKKGDTGNLIANSLDSHGNLFRWCVTATRASDGVRVYEGCTTESAAENNWEVPPGLYNLQFYKSTEITWTRMQNIEIMAGQDTRVDIPQAGRLIVKSNINGAVIQATPKAENIQAVTFNANQPQELLPGTYDLTTWGGISAKRSDIQITSGQETVIEINGGQ